MDLVKIAFLLLGLGLVAVIVSAFLRAKKKNEKPYTPDMDRSRRNVEALIQKSAGKNTLDISDAPPAPSAPRTDIRGVYRDGAYYNSVLGMKLSIPDDGGWVVLTGKALYEQMSLSSNRLHGDALTEKYEGADEGIGLLLAGTTDDRVNLCLNAMELEPGLAAQLTQEDLLDQENQAAIADGLKASGATGITVTPGIRILNGGNVPVLVARGSSPMGPICQVAWRTMAGNYQINVFVTSRGGDESQTIFNRFSSI